MKCQDRRLENTNTTICFHTHFVPAEVHSNYLGQPESDNTCLNVNSLGMKKQHIYMEIQLSPTISQQLSTSSLFLHKIAPLDYDITTF